MLNPLWRGIVRSGCYLSKTAVFLLVALLVGCASSKQVKEMSVSESTTIEGVNAERLSSCVFETNVDRRAIYRRNYDVIQRKWFIVSEVTTLLGSGTGSHNYSMAFSDTVDGTLVEIRSRKTVWGEDHAPIEQIFETAEGCKRGLAKP